MVFQLFLFEGDSAYPLSQHLITPFRDNGRLTREQRHFNTILSSARQVVERSIGHLKCRFRRLRDIECGSIQNTCTLVTSACIMHNLCIFSNDNLTEYLDMREEDYRDPNNFPPVIPNANEGVQKRNAMVQYFQQFMWRDKTLLLVWGDEDIIFFSLKTELVMLKPHFRNYNKKMVGKNPSVFCNVFIIIKQMIHED